MTLLLDLALIGAFLLSVCWLPGAAIIRLGGVGNRFGPFDQALLAVPLSLLTMPPLLFLFGHVVPVRAELGIAVATATVLALYIFNRKSLTSTLNPEIESSLTATYRIWLMVGLTILLGATLLILLQTWAPRFILPAVGDYTKHQGIIYSLADHTLPPINPFFTPGIDLHLSYYYMFHILPASLMASTDIPPANLYALIAFCVGFSALATMARFIKTAGGSTRSALLGVLLLLGVGGLDIVPLAAEYFRSSDSCQLSWSCWWENVPVYASGWGGGELKTRNFLSAATWVPHHMLATTALFLIPLLYVGTKYKKRFWLLVPWVLVATAGTSIYVALFGVLVGTTFLATRLKGKPFELVRHEIMNRSFWVSALAAIAVSTAFFWEIRPHAGAATAGFSFGVIQPGLFSALGFEGSETIVMRMLDWVATILLGLGPLLLCLTLDRRGLKRISPYFRWGTWVLASSLMLSLFVRSSGHYNDFGFNLMLSAQFSLVFLAALSLERWSHHRTWLKALVIGGFFVGFLSPLHDVLGLGIHRLQAQTPHEDRNRAFIEAATFLRLKTDETAIIQAPVTRRSYLLTISHRRSAVLDHLTGSLLNIPAGAFDKSAEDMTNLFRDLKSETAAELAREYRIDYLLFRNDYRPPQMISSFRIVFENDHYTVAQVLNENRRWTK